MGALRCLQAPVYGHVQPQQRLPVCWDRPPQTPLCVLLQVYTCDLSSHAISTDEVRPMATPRHTFGAATAAGRVYVVGHGRLADEQETTEFFDPGGGGRVCWASQQSTCSQNKCLLCYPL